MDMEVDVMLHGKEGHEGNFYNDEEDDDEDGHEGGQASSLRSLEFGKAYILLIRTQAGAHYSLC